MTAGAGVARDAARIRVLGVVGVSRGAARADLGSGRALALLALFALDRRRARPDGELAAALWDADATPGTTAALRVHVSELRRRVEPLGIRVVRMGAGYLLDPGEAAIDLDAARVLVTRGDAAYRSRDFESAALAYALALDAWSGVPLANVEAPFAAPARARLEFWRRTIRQNRLAAELELGLGPMRLDEALELCELDPLDERAARHRMLALLQAGRRSEALSVYSEFRAREVDSLGVEPGPALAAAQAAVLAGGDAPGRVSAAGSRLPRRRMSA